MSGFETTIHKDNVQENELPVDPTTSANKEVLLNLKNPSHSPLADQLSTEAIPQNALYEESDEEPHVVLGPSSGWAALNLKQIWVYRDLLAALAARDVKLRYRQTVLGVVWVILQPLLAAGIFSFVFGTIGKFPSDGVPYIVFSYAGLLAWNAFSTTLSKVSTVLLQNSNLISKIFFPRLILPFSVIYSTLIDFAVAMVVMVILMIMYHINPGFQVLLLPLFLGLIILLSVGLGLIASALAVSYRDIQYVVPVAVQMLLYASPIAYSMSGVPAHWRVYFLLNPLSGLLDAFRWVLLGTGEMNVYSLAYSTVASIAIFAIGAIAFKKMERKFADVI